MHAQPLTPKLREAVRAIAEAPDRKLIRCGAGYMPRNHPERVVTRRAAGMLERDYITKYQGDMDAEVVLTSKGERIANEIARAGAK